MESASSRSWCRLLAVLCAIASGLFAAASTALAAEAPTVGSGTATAVGSSTATVSSEIDPGGSPTSYRVEYVSATQFEASEWAGAARVPSPDAELPGSTTPLSVNEQLGGLQPETPYRFRFVARSSFGEVAAVSATFTTAAPDTEGTALPDKRAYELVSPPDEGELYLPPTPIALSNKATGFRALLPFRAAADGEAVAWVGEPALSVGTGETGPGEGNEWLSKRSAEGWKSNDITPTNSAEVVFEGFSADLMTGLVLGPDPLTTPGQHGCKALYSRATAAGTFSPLFDSGESNCGSPLFAGASENESRIIFQDQSALTANALPATELPPGRNEHSSPEGPGAPCMFGCNLYEESAGQLQLVSELEGKPVPDATFGGYSSLERELTTFSHAISSDGSRIFWTDTQAGADMEHVYVRENGTSIPVSRGAAEFWTATPDGRDAFYTENGELWRYDTETHERLALTGIAYGAIGTGDTVAGSDEVSALATASGRFHRGENIFGAGIPAGTRIDEITGASLRISNAATATGAGIALTSGGSQVQGVLGVNETGEDGAYVYFVAEGALAPGATVKICETFAAQAARTEREAREGLITEEQVREEFERNNREEAEEKSGVVPPETGCNLYVRHGDTTTLVGTLSAADNFIRAFAGGGLESTGDWVANVGEHIVQVTPDGRHLVFQSHRMLTGYDSRYDKEPQLEVFVYSADNGRLACASCTPTGAPPAINESNEGGSKLPESTEAADTYARRLISENGSRVFFASTQPLLPQDANGAQDVYEWEAEGEGTCTPRTPARLNDGCIYLLSGGISRIDTFPVEADATGDNVFFEHIGPLGQIVAPVDHNLLYDARVMGGFPTTSLACTGTGCQGVPPGPPIFATPASVTFSGIGNFPAPVSTKLVAKPLNRAQKLARALKICRRDRRKSRRVNCGKQARKKYGAEKASSKAKKASNERGAQS